MSAPPEPEMRRGAVGRGTPEVEEDGVKKQPRHYHIPTDAQAFLTALSPWLAILLALYAAGRQ
jgi:hypothetical protein